MRTCKRCGGTYPDVAFRVSQRDYAKYTQRKSSRLATTCRICEITARTDASHKNPTLVKARNALRHHARTFLERVPWNRTNVRWVCRTCNTEKQRTPPDKWAEYLGYCDQWRNRQEELKANPWAGLGPLFEGIRETFQARLF